MRKYQVIWGSQTMKIAVFWNVISCTMIESYLDYRRPISEDSHFQAQCSNTENLATFSSFKIIHAAEVT
jgi:hypothetical protein